MQNPTQSATLTKSARARNQLTYKLWNHLLFDGEATLGAQKSYCQATRRGKWLTEEKPLAFCIP